MTNPKQLENVKTDILAVLQNGPELTKENFQERLEAVAQAAIEAASRPLPIEDAPSDESRIDVFLNDSINERIPDVYLDQMSMEFLESGTNVPVINDRFNKVTGWLPIPTQEGE